MGCVETTTPAVEVREDKYIRTKVKAVMDIYPTRVGRCAYANCRIPPEARGCQPDPRFRLLELHAIEGPRRFANFFRCAAFDSEVVGEYSRTRLANTNEKKKRIFVRERKRERGGILRIADLARSAMETGEALSPRYSLVQDI